MRTADRFEEILGLGAATMYEASAEKGAVDPEVRPVWANARTVGPAFTVRCAVGDNWALHRAIAAAEPGSVLVCDAASYIAGYWGDVMTCAAQARGLAGLIIDGGVRDVADIRRAQFPVFARGVSVRGTVKNSPGELGVEVVIGGVEVSPNDMIVADDDGVVVVRASELDETVRRARVRASTEARFRADIGAGAQTLDLLGLRRDDLQGRAGS